MTDPSSILTFLENAAAVCRTALVDNGLLIGTLFAAGLVGGATHCAGMCAPFVLAQVTAGGCDPGRPLTEFGRLRGAALLPYHLGRMTTYAILGGAAAALAGKLVAITTFRWLAAVLLLTAAVLFLIQSLHGLGRYLRRAGAGLGTFATAGSLAPLLARAARPFLADPDGLRGYALGVVLGFLPCGLLYGALAAAAAAEGPAGGALAMAGFAAGTVPALVGVGFAGHFFARRWSTPARTFASVLMLVDAGILTALAWSVAA